MRFRMNAQFAALPENPLQTDGRCGRRASRSIGKALQRPTRILTQKEYPAAAGLQLYYNGYIKRRED